MANKSTKKYLTAFSAGGVVALLAGLIGLGGAEFRLPLLKSLFAIETLRAVILNKATSLVVVFFALIFRSSEVSFELLFEHKSIILNLLSGSLIGAWIAAGYAMKISESLLNRIIFFVLISLALLLIYNHFFLESTQMPLFKSAFFEIISSFIAGIVIGSVASLLGVAGGELLIPTITILYGVDLKLAGSLSLAVSLPTIIVGFFRYAQSQAFVVFQEQKGLFIALALGSVVGVAIGAALLGAVASELLVLLLVGILLLSAYKSFRE